MALIQLNKNGGLRLNGKKAKRASRKSLAAAAGAVGINTTKKVQKTVEEKLTKNELIAALRNKSTGTWTKKHGGGRKRVEGPMSMEELIGRHLNKMRAHQGAGLAKRNRASNRWNATAARRAVKLAAHKKAVANRKAARMSATAARRAAIIANRKAASAIKRIIARRQRLAQIPARLKAKGLALKARREAVAARAAVRKQESQARKEAAAQERMLERASVMFARNQAKKNAVAVLANKRAERLSKLRASMQKVLGKKRTWTNSEVANLRLKLAKAKKPSNITKIRKEAAKYKKKYVRKAKEVAKGSLNAKPKKKRGAPKSALTRLSG